MTAQQPPPGPASTPARQTRLRFGLLRLAAPVVVLALLVACSTPAAPGLPDAGVLFRRADPSVTVDPSGTAAPSGTAVWLLGELHDNTTGHALRLQTLTRLVAGGARPALLMEQFDRELQTAIDREQQPAPGMPPGDAEFDAAVDALVRLASPPGAAPGWDWALYRPVLRLALQYRLPIVAANVSRRDARQVIAQGLAATGFDPGVPADIADAQATAIVASHCGQVSMAQAGRMALAQVARDQFMARQVGRYAGRGVVLLAGNGHVRKDLGMPRWLDNGTRQRSWAVAYLEPDSADITAFDQVVQVPEQPRVDPCKAMGSPQQPATP